jgi:ABC-type dipeptide/oligopeptide/nickel transport system permease subunit
LLGVWTGSAAGSFKRIVDTRGSDISHLMEALSALHKMYAMIYTLIIIGLLLFLAAVGLFIFAQMAR